jgi:hypothetical protein
MLLEYAGALLKYATPIIEPIGATPEHDDRGVATKVLWRQTVNEKTYANQFVYQHGLVVFQFQRSKPESDPVDTETGYRSVDRCSFAAYCGWKNSDCLESFRRTEIVRGAIASHDYHGVSTRIEETLSIDELTDCKTQLYQITFSLPLPFMVDRPKDHLPRLQLVIATADERSYPIPSQ